MPRKRSNLSRNSNGVQARKLARRKEKIDLEKLEQEVYDAMIRLDEMRRQYAEYVASQQHIESSEQALVKQEGINESVKSAIGSTVKHIGNS